MKKFLLFAILLISFKTYAQPIQFNWAQGMGGNSQATGRGDFIKDGQGYLFVTGEFQGTKTFGPYTLTATGFTDVYVARYDTTGLCLWVKKGGYAGGVAHAGSIAVDNVGNIYVTGTFTSAITFDFLTQFSVGAYDIFTVKLDYQGNAVWLNQAGGSSNDYVNSIFIDNNELYSTGSFIGSATFGTINLSSSSSIDVDAFITHYDLAGTCVWAVKAGGTDVDAGSSIKKDLTGGNLIVTGNFTGIAMFGTNSITSYAFGDMFIAKYDLSGNNIWVSKGGGNGNDVGNSVGIDQFGNSYVTGSIGDTAFFGTHTVLDNGYGNMFIAKYNSSGVCQWAKGGGGTSNDGAVDIAVRADGACFVTGIFNGIANFSGQILSSSGASDAFMVIYTPSGTVASATKIGGAGFDFGISVVEDATGIIYAGGEFTGTVNFGSTSLTSAVNVWSTYLTKLSGITVGMNEVKPQFVSLNVYPNPATDIITLDFPKITNGNFTAELINQKGEIIFNYNIKISGGQLTLPMNNYPSGVYYIRLKNESTEFLSRFILSSR